MSDMIDYLKSMKRLTAQMKAPCIEGVVLDNGHPFASPAVARPEGVKKGENKMCFMNSYNLAIENNFGYVEGFAVCTVCPLPLHHAWCIDRQGGVIETTWADAGLDYFGIPLEFSFIHEVLFETRRYGVLTPESAAFRKRFWS
jgi:hypothetical protein